jgi:hypothetical protein
MSHKPVVKNKLQIRGQFFQFHWAGQDISFFHLNRGLETMFTTLCLKNNLIQHTHSHLFRQDAF